MATPDFLKRLGLFVERKFLDDTTCAELRTALRASNATPATIYDGTAHKLEEGVRRTLRAEMAPSAIAQIQSRLMEIKPRIARHFDVELSGCQEPAFLVYRPGDFFSAHADGGDDPDEPDNIRARKISAVIFLTDETVEPHADSHSGGSLVFYNLVSDPRLAKRGVPLTAERGLLIAFRATTVHQVTVVTAGERYTIVSWFV